MNENQALSYFIKQEALQLGFAECGIASTDLLIEEINHLKQWLKKGYNAQMGYMENHLPIRENPALLVENAKSVVALLSNYFPEKSLHEDSDYLISKYAYGKDYHDVIREKLNVLIQKIQEKKPHVTIRGFVDSAPVLERAWAVRAGLGWIGKNSMLITKKGSFFFISELILDVELQYDHPFTDNFCGNCTRCIDACPTKAIVSEKIIDSTRCISYQTIENKDQIANELAYKQWIFGCDICQDICPWNRFASPHNEVKLLPNDSLFGLTKTDWAQMTEEQFTALFKVSAVKRAKFAGLKRNIAFLGNAALKP